MRLPFFTLLLLATPLFAASGSVLQIAVTTAEGKKLDQAQLTLTRTGNPPITVPQTEPGLFEAKVEPNTYALSLSCPGFAAVNREVTVASDTPTRLALSLDIAELFEEVSVTGTEADATVFKFPATVHATPRALTVIGEEDLREHHARSVNDTFAYTPGMSVNSYRTGGYHFYARGYRMGADDTRIDGATGVNAGGRYAGSLFGIEKVVILRGPAGLLYGSTGNPGGLVNMVTKKPVKEGFTRVDLHTGGYAGQGLGLGDRSTGGLDLDSTGKLSENGRILYRALGQFENADYFSEGIEDKNRAFNTTLSLQLDDADRFRLSPQVQWTRFDRPHGGGLVISPSTSLTTQDGIDGPINDDDLSPLNVRLSEGGGIDETRQTGLSFQGVFSAALHLNASYRDVRYDTDIDQYAPVVSTAAQRALLRDHHQVLRQHSKSQTERIYRNADLNATYEWLGSAHKNRIQVGMTTRDTETRATRLDGSAPGPHAPINIYTGAVSSALDASYPNLVWNDWTGTRTWNGYVQNQLGLNGDRWVITAGLGYGQDTPKNQDSRASELMPNGSVMFHPTPELAFYASYATSYNPSDPSLENQAGQAGEFGPKTGKNEELGLKWDVSTGQSLAMSLFSNKITNDLVQSAAGDTNPNGNTYYIEVGTREAEGAELTYESRKGGLALTTTVSYLDAIYTGAGPASSTTLPIAGSRAEKSPEWATSLWARYGLARGRLRGLGASVGWIWNDERLGSNSGRTQSAPDPLVLPAFSRWDLGLSYDLNRDLALDLHVENVLDELIYVNATVGSSIEIARPRSLDLRLSYQF